LETGHTRVTAKPQVLYRSESVRPRQKWTIFVGTMVSLFLTISLLYADFAFGRYFLLFVSPAVGGFISGIGKRTTRNSLQSGFLFGTLLIVSFLSMFVGVYWFRYSEFPPTDAIIRMLLMEALIIFPIGLSCALASGKIGSANKIFPKFEGRHIVSLQKNFSKLKIAAIGSSAIILIALFLPMAPPVQADLGDWLSGGSSSSGGSSGGGSLSDWLSGLTSGGSSSGGSSGGGSLSDWLSGLTSGGSSSGGSDWGSSINSWLEGIGSSAQNVVNQMEIGFGNSLPTVMNELNTGFGGSWTNVIDDFRTGFGDSWTNVVNDFRTEFGNSWTIVVNDFRGAYGGSFTNVVNDFRTEFGDSWTSIVNDLRSTYGDSFTNVVNDFRTGFGNSWANTVRNFKNEIGGTWAVEIQKWRNEFANNWPSKIKTWRGLLGTSWAQETEKWRSNWGSGWESEIRAWMNKLGDKWQQTVEVWEGAWGNNWDEKITEIEEEAGKWWVDTGAWAQEKRRQVSDLSVQISNGIGTSHQSKLVQKWNVESEKIDKILMKAQTNMEEAQRQYGQDFVNNERIASDMDTIILNVTDIAQIMHDVSQNPSPEKLQKVMKIQEDIDSIKETGTVLAVRVIPVYDPVDKKWKTFDSLAIKMVKEIPIVEGTDIANDPVETFTLMALEDDYWLYAKIIPGADGKPLSIIDAAFDDRFYPGEANTAIKEFNAAKSAYLSGDMNETDDHLQRALSITADINDPDPTLDLRIMRTFDWAWEGLGLSF
jgi:hypothetical protein